MGLALDLVSSHVQWLTFQPSILAEREARRLPNSAMHKHPTICEYVWFMHAILLS